MKLTKERVQPRLARAPVVAVSPVVAQRLPPRQRRALTPIVHRLPLGPARARQPLALVVERGSGKGERVRLNRVGHGQLCSIIRSRHRVSAL